MKSKPTAETLANIAKFLYDCAKLTAAAAFITPHVESTFFDNSIVLRFGFLFAYPEKEIIWKIMQS